MEVNTRLLAGSGSLSGDAFDTAIEAFVLAEASGQAVPSPWTRARRPQDPSAARLAGALRSALERLGYVHGCTWSRSKGMARSLGVNDPEDVKHHPPVFTWEVAEGLRLAPPPALPWELAGAALTVLGSISAKRKGACLNLLVGEVAEAGEDTVTVGARARPKHHHARATGRPRRQPKPVALKHWLIGAYVTPWVRWHARHGSPPSALLFPAITQAPTRSASANGFKAEGGQWVEPSTKWSDRAVATALQKYVFRLGSRSFQGLRAGNNRELRRNTDISAIPRRSLHDRSLKPIIGSEEAYDAPFAEDFTSATEALGRMRIESGVDGLLTVVATSASAGRDPSDWVILPTAARTPIPEEESSGPEDSSEGEEQEDQVAGQAFDCGRCGAKVASTDYGWLCDVEACDWGACTSCHTGGARAPLRCPRHALTR